MWPPEMTTAAERGRVPREKMRDEVRRSGFMVVLR
jgi:hypothetical protein